MKDFCERLKLLSPAVAATALVFAGLLSPRAQQTQPDFAFRNVDVFDGSRMIRRTTVVVQQGMIRAVGRNIEIPSTAQVIDGSGKTLLPGFFDAHTHLGLMYGEQFLRDALDFGVTTELEMGGGAASLSLRKTASDSPDMADLRTAGTVITVPKGHPTQMDGGSIPTLGPGDDPQAFVDARIAEGGDYIKIVYEHAFPTLTKRQLDDLIAAAHRRNRLALVHVTTQNDARDAIAAGADGLVHIFADASPAADFAEFAARHHVFVIPTLSVFEIVSGASKSPWWQSASNVGPYITPSMRGSLQRKMPPGIGGNLKFTHAIAAVRALHRAGVPILAGTDAPTPGLAHGLSLHHELELLVQSGLTPLEALASATSESARAFGFHDRGRILEGKRADLVLVDGDPSINITATRAIVEIWKLGVRHKRRGNSAI